MKYRGVHQCDDGSCCDCYGLEDPTFVCPTCGRVMGYCYGSSDSDDCDDCWYRKQHAQTTEPEGALQDEILISEAEPVTWSDGRWWCAVLIALGLIAVFCAVMAVVAFIKQHAP